MHRGRLARGLTGLTVGAVALLLAGPLSAQDAAAWLNRGDEARRAGEPEVAESAYRQALVEGWLLDGDLEAAEQDFEGAFAAYEQAARYGYDADTAKRRQSSVLAHQKRYDEAREILQILIGKTPFRLDLRREMANLLFAAGRPAEAVQELEDLRGSGNPEADFALATAYLRAGRLAEAEERFEAVIKARPIPQTLVLIGRALRDAKFFDAAKPYLERALEQDPDTLRARFYLGTLVLYSQGRDPFEDAVDYFRGELELRQRLDPDTRDTVTHLSLGLTLAEMRRFEDALPHLGIAALDPDAARDALHNSGRCLLSLGRDEEAVAMFEKALEHSNNASTEQLTSLHYQLAQALRRVGRMDDAEVHFELAKASSGRYAQANRDRLSRFLADQIETENGFVAAIGASAALAVLSNEERQRIRDANRRSMTTAFFNLGVFQLRQGRHALAARLLGEASAFTPDYPRLQYSLGIARFNAAMHAEAVEPLRLARDQASDRATAAQAGRMLALALFNAGQYAEAAALLGPDLDRADDPSLQFTYAVSLVRSGRVDEAQRVFDGLLAAGHDWPQLQVAIGQAQAQDGNFPAAVETLTRALELDPTLAEANASLGEIHLRQGQFAEAETHFRAELENRPRDAQTRFHLATALDLAEAHDAAVTELQAVLELAPEHADARYLLGKIHLAEGRAGQALPELLAAAGLAPEESNIFYQLGLTYRSLNRMDDAAAAFETYRRLKKASREAP